MRIAILLVGVLLFASCTSGNATKSIGKPLTCFDTDGGKVFDAPGSVVTKSSGGFTTTDSDYCYQGELIEYYCDRGNYPRSITTKCDCLSGTCI